MRPDELGISLVVPMFDVREYLPRFLDSLSRQDTRGCALELIFIDDGSSDDSADLVEEWMRCNTHLSARLLRQPNQGVSAARNRGLDAATREWVSFPDPDDVLADGYLRSVSRFLRAHGNVDAATASILRIDERRGRIRDIHPLRTRFAAGSRVVDLDLEPDTFLLNVATAFFPRAGLIRTGIRFTAGLHASEDALFVADWFLSLSRSPRLGLMAEARYLYRRRAAGSSAVDGYRRDPGTYITRFRDGYLSRLRDPGSKGAPAWLQRVLLYEYRWLFDAQASGSTYASALDDDQREEVLQVARDCLRHVDSSAIDDYAATPLGLETRYLLHVLKGEVMPTAGPYVTRVRNDEVECRWIAEASAPPPRAAVHAKRRVPDYFGQQLIVEWIAWLPQAAVEPATIRVPSRTSLARWSPPAHRRATLSWSLRSAARQARATWASRIGVLRALAGMKSRDLWVLVPTGLADETTAALTLHAQERGHKLVTLAVTGTGGREHLARKHVLMMLRAAVVISSAPFAEAVASAQPQGARRRWMGVAVLEIAPDRAEAVALEAAFVDLIAAATVDLAEVVSAPESNLGYTSRDIIVTSPGELIAAIEKRLPSSTRTRRTRP